jgi:hypothetical protein
VAKPSNKAADRRAVVEQLRKEQQRKERRQGLLVVGAAVLVGVVIIGFAALQLVKSNKDAGRDLNAIGLSTSAAKCQPIQKQKPEGQEKSGTNGNHVNTGTPITYRFSPPAFGQHWPNYLQGAELRSFYTTDDRPEVERLVHSLEHGYTILWYDQTVADDSDALADVRAIAKKFPDPSSLDEHFIAAPWTSQDGDPFPDGTHVALTHWSVGGKGGSQAKDQVGVWEYCGGVSGAVVDQFRTDYPPLDAPEAGAS